MLKVDQLVKRYGDLTAVNEISFEAAKGSVLGLLGPNGAGKSTTIHCISGLLQPSAGSIAIAGVDLLSDPKKAKRSLGVVPQELALYEDLPAIENLRFWGRAYGLRGEELESRVREVLVTIGLGDRASDLPREFSGGMKRRLNFGCGIVHRPAVMLLDEPTVGVDPQSRERLFELVEAERDRGTCVLYTTHYMEEAERLCDSVAIIDHGKLVIQGSVSELRAKMKARDVLQLQGDFPVEATRQAIAGLDQQIDDDLELISIEPGHLTLALSSASLHLSGIFQALSGVGGKISETSLRSPSLETLFLILTGKELRE